MALISPLFYRSGELSGLVPDNFSPYRFYSLPWGIILRSGDGTETSAAF
jgi:hypothetical protein